MFINTKKEKTGLIFLISLFVLIIGNATSVLASMEGDVKKGNNYYKKDDYSKALEKYDQALERDPLSAIISFNKGTALYKLKDYAQAIENLNFATLTEDLELKEQVHFNLGNANYQRANRLGSEDLMVSLDHSKEAVAQFENALAINWKNEDAKYNLELAERLVEKIEKQVQQNRQSSDQSKDQSQENNNDQEDQDSQNKEENNDSNQSQQEENQDDQSQSSNQNEQQQNSEQDQESQNEQNNNEDQEDEQSQSQPDSNEEEKKNEQEQANEDQSSANEQAQDNKMKKENKELTEQEAQTLLQSYQQSVEPRGLLNVYKQKFKSQSVLKDW